MSYYDNVKDSVKDEKKEAKSSSNGSGGTGNFSTLKEEAEKNINEDKNDDTPIEVLEEGGLSSKSSSSGSQSSQNSSSGSSGNPMTQSSDNTSSGGQSVDASGIEEKLDRIIEQNARMIEVLESFGN